MWVKILCLVAIIAACEADVIERTARNTRINSYHVFTRNNRRDPFDLDETNIANSPIQAGDDTVVIIHGHGGTAFSTLNPTVQEALLRNDTLNVIVVDWSLYASLSYSNAVVVVPTVGNDLAEMLTRLAEAPYNLIEYSQLHIVGFNLGAHAAGFAGRRLGGRVARITGLDPSGSQWENNPNRLNTSAARYVEVIHTDSKSNGIGIPLGHVDFFASGGSNQPGCVLHICSHNRAYELFAASLTTGGLLGNHCATTTQLNLNLCRGYTLELGTNLYDKDGSGIFRINTRRAYPYF